MPARSSTPAGKPAPGPTLEVIAHLAELMWQQEGCPEGRDIEFWLRAEAELTGSDLPTLHDPQA